MVSFFLWYHLFFLWYHLFLIITIIYVGFYFTLVIIFVGFYFCGCCIKHKSKILLLVKKLSLHKFFLFFKILRYPMFKSSKCCLCNLVTIDMCVCNSKNEIFKPTFMKNWSVAYLLRC